MGFFSGKVVVVTGGASGIGGELCRALCQRGSHVVIADIDLKKAQTISDHFETKGYAVQAAHLDVTNHVQVDDVINAVVQEHGRIDLMFNNAGIGVGGEFQHVGADFWRKIVDINLLGVVFGTQAAYRHMCEQGFGQIVNIASMWGLYSGIMQTAYSATKHGVVGMTQGLRAEAKALGVKVQVVCPGYIETSLFDASLLAGDLNVDDLRERIPIKFLEVETAVKKILKGVEKNQAFIVFPFYVRFFWWIQRISPAFFTAFSSLAMRMQRNRA